MNTREKQRKMWDEMQRRGYFRNHPVYRDWRAEEDKPIEVLKRSKIPLSELPEALNGIDFTADDIVFDCPDLDTFTKEIDPLLKEYEELWLPKIIDLYREMRVLDIGCGYGRTEAWMWRYVKEVWGIDISPYVIEICRERFKGIKNVFFASNQGDDLSIFEDGQFDLIYCFNVLQHIPRDFTYSYLKEIKRVLKRGGHAFFNLLSGMNYDMDAGPDGAEWAIGYRERDIKEYIDSLGLKVSRILRWRLKTAEPYWIWFLIEK